MSHFKEIDIERREGARSGQAGGGGGETGPLGRVVARLHKPRRSASGIYSACCPAHDDKTASLSAGGTKAGGAWVRCHAGCTRSQILKELGLEAQDLRPEAKGRKKRLTRAEADQLLEERGIRSATRKAFEITTDLTRQAWRFAIATGAKFKRFPGNDGAKYVWEKPGKPPNAELYGLAHLPEGTVHAWLLEGEPDVWIAWQAGLPAISFTGGADTVPEEGVRAIVEAGITHVSICYDADAAGRMGAQKAAAALAAEGASVDIRAFPEDRPAGFDVTDLYNEVERDASRFAEALDSLPSVPMIDVVSRGLTPEDFHAYLPEHRYIYAPTGAQWPAASINALLGKIEDLQASTYLDRNRGVELLTWAPGLARLIHDRLLIDGGWVERPGATCFNQFLPSAIEPGDASAAGPWLEHAYLIFPEEADHLIRWLAFKVQYPGEKVNHALLLGGMQGTGKDTFIEGAVPAIGTWNVQGVTPEDMFGEFNPFAKSVLLRVNEARDLGDRDRYRFYERLKLYIAAPPMVLHVNEKHIRPYPIPNVCGVVITTNHSDAVFISPDDRRFLVAWTDKTKEDFPKPYWKDMHGWYASGGVRHIAAYLLQLDLGDFDPKAPPPKTPAFWSMVDAGRSPEDSELADAIDRLGNPPALTVAIVVAQLRDTFGISADDGPADWFDKRGNRRQIRHRFEAVGYSHVPNENADDGRWKIGSQRVPVYARSDLPRRDRFAAAARLVADHAS